MNHAVRSLISIGFGLIATLTLSSANAADVPQTFTLDGKLFSDAAGTTPLQDNSIVFTVQILDEAKICVLYEETQSLSTLASKGYFSMQVGSETGGLVRTAGDSGNSMATVFQNIGTINGKLLSNGSPCTAGAVPAKRRFVRIKVAPSTMGGAARTLSPDLTIDSVPNAVVAERAETLQGLRANNVLQVNTTGTNQLSQSNLESLFTSTTRFNALSSVVDGTSPNYMRSNSASGAQLPVMTGAPSGPTPGSLWYDSSDSKIKFQTSGGPVTLGTGGGSVSSVGFTAPSELSVAGAPVTSSGTIAVTWATQTANKVFAAPDGTTGTPTFRAMVANDIPNLPWSKITSGTPTTLLGYGITDAVKNVGGTPSLESGLDAAKGAATTAGRVWISTDTKQIYRDNGTTWDLIGSGAAGGGTVTNVTSANSYLSVANGTTTPALTVNVGTAANTVAAGNDSRITGALQQATAFSGDVSGAYNATSVDKIKGTAVSITALGTGNFLKYNGTAWANASLGASDITTALTYTPVDKAGDTMTGLLVLSADPSANLGAATKQYVDSSTSTAGANYLRKDGTVALTADWDADGAGAGTRKITGLAAPTAGDGAVTKTYADTKFIGATLPAAPAAGQNGQSIRWNNGSSTWEYYTAGSGGGDFMANGSVPMTGSLKMGGNAIYGNSTSGGNLTLESTSNATKGNVIIAPTTGKVGVFTTSPRTDMQVNGILLTNRLSISDGDPTFDYTYIEAPSTNKLGFYTTDTQRMLIDDSGNVGIGTGTPVTSLDINGGQTFRGVAAATTPAVAGQGKIYFDSTANKFKVSENNGAFVDLVGGGGTVTSVSSANSYLSVTNGTTTPSLTLNVGTAANTVAAGNDSRITGALQQATAFSGDVSGAYNATSVDKIKGTAVTITSLASGNFLKYNGTAWVNSSLAAGDITGALTYTPVNKAGDTMTGLLVLSADPAANLGAATKQYVDSSTSTAAANYLHKDGTVALTADWDVDGAGAGTRKITGLAAPTAGDGAATKTYADTKFVTKDLPAAPGAGQNGQSLRWNNGSSTWEYYTAGSGGGDFMKDGSVAMTGTLKMGGNTVYGNSTASGNLTLESTSNATKGYVNLQPNGGNVGIGTATPSSLLDLKQNQDAETAIQITNQNAGASAETGIEFTNNTGMLGGVWMGSSNFYPTYANRLTVSTYPGSSGTVFEAQDPAGQLFFHTGGSGTTYERMRITSAGTVGIGTTNPTERLDVTQANQAAIAVTSTTAGASDTAIKFNTPDRKWSFGSNIFNIGAGKFNIFDATALASRLVIDTSGNVGIGTASPATALDVNGGQTFRGVAAATTPAVAGQGKIYFDSTANKFKVSENNGAYVDLVGGGGTVTSVSSANSYLTVTNGTTTPSLTVNVGTAANTVAAGNDSRITGALQQATAFSGDVSGAYNATSVDKIKGTAVTITSLTSGNFLKYNGTAWVNSNLAAGDITGALTYTPVNKAGDTMTGLLVLSADPAANLGASTKQYVDSSTSTAAANYLRKDATVALTADWDIDGAGAGTRKLTGLAAPTAGDGAVTKTYADTKLIGATLPAAPAVGQNGQALRWNNGTTAWEYYTPAAGGGDFMKDGSVAMTGDLKMGSNQIRWGSNSYLSSDGNGLFKLGYASGGTDGVLRVQTVENVGFVSGGYVAGGTNTAGNDLVLTGQVSTGNANGGSVIFRTSPPGASGSTANTIVEAMRVSPSGNVGVGTATPTLGKMVVQDNGNSSKYVLNLVNNDSGTSASTYMGFYNNLGLRSEIYASGSNNSDPVYKAALGMYAYNGGGGILITAEGGAGDDVRINASPFLTATPSMIIKNGGNVGIGIATPATLLDVNGGMTFRGVAAATTPAVAGQGKIYYDSTANKFKVSENNGAFVNLVGGSGTVTSVTSSNSYLSVATGTTTPALTVNVGTAANTVAAGNDSRITGALQAATAFTGDVSGVYSATSVDKIKGTGVAITTLTTGNFLRYNGTNWVNTLLSSGDVTTGLGYTPVNKAGDTMTGLLVLSADPSANLGASTKQYVDAVTTSSASNYVRKDGTSALSADWDIDGAGAGTRKITGLADPTASDGAVTKNYADTKFITKTLPAAPAAGQNGQSIRWNNGTTAWEYYTPGSGAGDFMKDGSVAMTGDLKMGTSQIRWGSNSYLSSDGNGTFSLAFTPGSTDGFLRLKQATLQQIDAGYSAGLNSAGQNVSITPGVSTGNASGGALIFKTSPAGGSGSTSNTIVEAMRIAGSGNVGIGTATPAYALSVAGPGGNVNVDVSSGNTRFISTGNFGLQGLGGTVIVQGSTLATDGFTSYDIGSSGNLWRDIWIGRNALVSGNVGIGTTSPGGLLDVQGAAGANGQVYVKGVNSDSYVTLNVTNGGNEAGILFQSTGTLLWEIYKPGSSQDLRFWTTLGGDIMTLTGSGVGIGTTAPGAKLDVAGTVKLGAAGGVITGMGTCTVASTAWTTAAITGKTCTGVPAATAMVFCAPATAVTGQTFSAIATAANTVTIVASVAGTTALKCYWVQP